MRKVSMLIGTCMLVALALTLLAQQATDLPPIMKDVAATQQSLRMNLIAKSAADVEKDASKLQNLFTQAGGIFKALKAQDAVDWAKGNADAAGAIVKAAKASDFDAATASAGTIQKSCKACHDVHREEVTPGSKQYKFK